MKNSHRFMTAWGLGISMGLVLGPAQAQSIEPVVAFPIYNAAQAMQGLHQHTLLPASPQNELSFAPEPAALAPEQRRVLEALLEKREPAAARLALEGARDIGSDYEARLVLASHRAIPATMERLLGAPGLEWNVPLAEL